MLLALALASVLAAEEPQAAVEEEELDSTRFKRVGFTALGGALGIAAPMLLAWGFEASQPRPCLTCPPAARDPAWAVGIGALPFTMGLGFGLGHGLTGGRSGVGFGFAGALTGYTLAGGLLALSSIAAAPRDWTQAYPEAGAGLLAAFSLIGGVLGMELRHSELVAGAKEWSFWRGLGSGAVYVVPFALAEVGLIALVSGLRDNTASIALMTVGTAANVFLSCAAAWGVNRAFNGRGQLWAAVVGALASGSLGLAFVAIHAHGPPQGGIFSGFSPSLTVIPILSFGAIIAALGPAVGLEWSGARDPEQPATRQTASDRNWQVQLGLTPGGGSLGIAGRF